MNKILVEVHVPVAGKSFDMFIPTHLMLHEAMLLIKKIAMEMSDGLFVASSETTLCNRSDGSILNINLSVYELGLKNGSKLMLI